MPVIHLNPSISSALPLEIRKMRTGLELKPREDNRIASPMNEKELTRADTEWDEPLQGELTKAPGATLEEMVSRKDVTCPRSTRAIGGKGDPELYGWWDRGKPASTARLRFGHGPDDAGSKGMTHSHRPLLDRARVTPSPKIEERLRQSAQAGGVLASTWTTCTTGPEPAISHTSPPRGEELSRTRKLMASCKRDLRRRGTHETPG